MDWGPFPFLVCPGSSWRSPYYLEVQVIQGFQARLPSLHHPDHLWGLVVLKGLQREPMLEGSFLEQGT